MHRGGAKMGEPLAALNPQILAVCRFRSTAQTPNSEKVKNQYCCRAMIWCSGRATLEWGGQTEPIGAHDVLYLTPDCPYRIRNTGGDFEVLNIWFTDRPTDDLVPTGTVFQESFDPARCRPAPDYADAPQLSRAVLLKNRPLFRFGGGSGALHGPAAALQARAWVLRLLSEVIAPTPPENLHAAPVLAYIRAHLCDPLDGGTLAVQFHCHRKTIGQWVKQATGMPLHRYILHQKCMYARQLMQETDLTVTDIAHLLSFYDSSHLAKCLRQDARHTSDDPSRPAACLAYIANTPKNENCLKGAHHHGTD